MNKNSSTYIIIYATVMVVVVATVLAIAAMVLQPIQNANVEVEKKGDVLASVGLARDAGKAKDKTAYINEEYQKYIVDAFIVNVAGDRIEGSAFEKLINLKAEYEKPAEQRELPVFVSQDNGKKLYILPVWGSGLWGAVWGYVALEGDWDTVYGAVFDHAGETPGLGAEISGEKFSSQFVGKKIFRDGQLVGITVLKGSGASRGNDWAVDAISGGTITSRGVQHMIFDCMHDYKAYIEKQRAAGEAPAVQTDAPVVENTENTEENEG